jgi:riboflavin biosynthesis pyrimidine reductase
LRQLLPGHDEVDLVALYGHLDALGPSRPAVRVNMIASADGAASSGGLSGALGGPADKMLFATLRSLADIVLVGSSTVRAEGYGPVRLDPVAQDRRIQAGLPAVPPIAVVTAACRLDWDSPFFTEAVERPVVVTVAASDSDSRARASEVADLVIAGDDRVDLGRAMAALAERGCGNVLAEGGPGLVAQLARAGLIDELCLTLSPALVGGPAGRILAGPDVEPAIGLEVCHVLEDRGFLFLRYRRP